MALAEGGGGGLGPGEAGRGGGGGRGEAGEGELGAHEQGAGEAAQGVLELDVGEVGDGGREREGEQGGDLGAVGGVGEVGLLQDAVVEGEGGVLDGGVGVFAGAGDEAGDGVVGLEVDGVAADPAGVVAGGDAALPGEGGDEVLGAVAGLAVVEVDAEGAQEGLVLPAEGEREALGASPAEGVGGGVEEGPGVLAAQELVDVVLLGEGVEDRWEGGVAGGGLAEVEGGVEGDGDDEGAQGEVVVDELGGEVAEEGLLLAVAGLAVGEDQAAAAGLAPDGVGEVLGDEAGEGGLGAFGGGVEAVGLQVIEAAVEAGLEVEDVGGGGQRAGEGAVGGEELWRTPITTGRPAWPGWAGRRPPPRPGSRSPQVRLPQGASGPSTTPATRKAA